MKLFNELKNQITGHTIPSQFKNNIEGNVVSSIPIDAADKINTNFLNECGKHNIIDNEAWNNASLIIANS